MASLRKRGKVWYYRFTDADGVKRERKGTTDKRVTDELARAAENQAAKVKAGVIDPRELAYATHEARPLANHLEDFRRYVADKGSDPKSANVTARRAQVVLELAKAKRISQISLSKTLDALATLRRPPSEGGDGKGLATETVNHYVRSVKQFSRWLWKDRRARDHALAHLATTSSDADRRIVRRALTHEEAARLVQTTASMRDVLGMSGPDRAIAYAVALGTGYRSEEIRSLTPESFHLDSTPPTVNLAASETKNGKEAVQPITASLATQLRAWLATRPVGKPLLPLHKRTADMIRVDLEQAGIPYETPDGVVDFHALRATYISHVVSSGASVKTAQTLARHSTPILTIGIYAKASANDLASAIGGLPDLSPISEHLAHPLPTGEGASGSAPTEGDADDDAEPAKSKTFSPDSNQSSRSGLG